MIDPKSITLICPINDLESKTIIQIAKRLKIDVRISKQKWGARLGKESSNFFENLQKNVVIVEMPDPEKEAELKEHEHFVIIIDHNRYRDLDRSNTLSSLEQFTNLIGYELSSDEKLIAANDRGHVWEMAKIPGVTLSQMRKIREDEMSVLNIGEGKMKQSQQDYYEHCIKFSNVAIVFTELTTVAYIANLGQFPSEKVWQKFQENPEANPLPTPNLLIVSIEKTSVTDLQKPVEASFFGEEKYIRDFDEILNISGNLPSQDYDSWSNVNNGRGFWGGHHKIGKKSIEKLLNAMLQSLLGTDLPYHKFSTILMVPFKTTFIDYAPEKLGLWQEKCIFDALPDPLEQVGKIKGELTDQKKKDVKRKIKIFEETEYFHHHVNDFLFKKDKNSFNEKTPVRYYETTNNISNDHPGKATIKYHSHLDKDDSAEYETTYDLTHLAIHRFYNDICILTLEITDTTKTQENLYRELYNIVTKKERTGDSNHLFYAENASSKAMHFTMLARQLNWEFEEQQKPGVAKIPVSIHLDINDTSYNHPDNNGQLYEHCFEKSKDIDKQLTVTIEGKDKIVSEGIDCLINRFVGQTNGYELLLDNRMFVYSFISLIGQKPTTSLQRENHNIWFSRYMYVDFAGNEYEYDREFTNELMKDNIYKRWRHFGTLYGFSRYSSVMSMFGKGFFLNKLFTDFQSMYYQMVLVAYFYRATLVDFSSRLAKMTRHLQDRKFSDEKFSDIRKDFVTFTNIYWFEELTNQIQGVEIFNHYKTALNLPALYQKVKEEIERAAELEAINQAEANEKKNRYIGISAFFVAILALLIGFFSMNFEVSQYVDLKNSSSWYNRIQYVSIFLPVLIAGFWLGNYLWKKLK